MAKFLSALLASIVLCESYASFSRALQYAGTWTPTMEAGKVYVNTGSEGTDPLYVCRTTLPNGDVVSGRLSNVMSCYVWYNGTEFLGNSVNHQVLVAENSMAWMSSVPSNANKVMAGMAGGQPTYVCRAMYTPTNAGPYGGYVTTTANSEQACAFSHAGQAIVTVAPAFEYLLSFPDTNLPGGAIPAISSPSSTPSPSRSSSATTTPLPVNRAIWLTYANAIARGYSFSNLVKAGSEGYDIYACRANLPDGRGTVGGKWETQGSFCDVPFDHTELDDNDYQLLVRSPYIAWSSYPLPNGAQPIISGLLDGSPVVLCRAWHPTLRSGPHSGYTTFAGSALPPLTGTADDPQCLFSYGGVVIAASSFQPLIMLPSSMGNVGFDDTGAWNGSAPFPAPSASPKHTPSPSATASPAPIVPGRVEWWNYTAGAMQAGVDGAQMVYVCRGYLTTGEIIPGKFLDGSTFCDVPWRNVEYVDTTFEALRYNPLLAWGPTVAAGAQAIVAGNYQGMDLKVCRAYHPTIANSGPHAGYTDGESYNGVPLCFFSYGGTIIRTAPFEYLYMLPIPSASPSPATQSVTPTAASLTASPSSSVTSTSSATRTPASSGSVYPTSTMTASATSTGTGTPSNTGTASNTGTPSNTGTSTGTATPTSSVTPSSSTIVEVPSMSAAPKATSDGKAVASPTAVATSGRGDTAIKWMVGIIIALVFVGAGYYVYRQNREYTAGSRAAAAALAAAGSNDRAPLHSVAPSAHDEPFVINDPRFHYPSPAARPANAHV